MTAEPLTAHLIPEYGRTIETDLPDDWPLSGVYSLADVLRLVADYELCRPPLPPHDFGQVRLLTGPAVDRKSRKRHLGWYLDLRETT